MKIKKSLLEEVDKTWKLANLINEANPVATGQSAPAQQGQQAPKQNVAPNAGQQPQSAINPQLADKNLTTNFDQAIAGVIANLPAILTNFTATVGDKDKQLDIDAQQPAQNQTKQPAQNQAQQPAQLKEGGIIRELKFDEEHFKKNVLGSEKELDEALITALLGTVASAPVLMKSAGWAMQKMGKKAGDPNLMQKAGQWLSKKGEGLHHKYINGLSVVVKKFMPNASEEQVHKASEALFMIIVSGLLVSGLSDPSMYKQLLLNPTKSGELTAYISKALPNLMKGAGYL